jgi:hypothetical protein
MAEAGRKISSSKSNSFLRMGHELKIRSLTMSLLSVRQHSQPPSLETQQIVAGPAGQEGRRNRARLRDIHIDPDGIDRYRQLQNVR